MPPAALCRTVDGGLHVPALRFFFFASRTPRLGIRRWRRPPRTGCHTTGGRTRHTQHGSIDGIVTGSGCWRVHRAMRMMPDLTPGWVEFPYMQLLHAAVSDHGQTLSRPSEAGHSVTMMMSVRPVWNTWSGTATH